MTTILAARGSLVPPTSNEPPSPLGLALPTSSTLIARPPPPPPADKTRPTPAPAVRAHVRFSSLTSSVRRAQHTQQEATRYSVGELLLDEFPPGLVATAADADPPPGPFIAARLNPLSGSVPRQRGDKSLISAAAHLFLPIPGPPRPTASHPASHPAPCYRQRMQPAGDADVDDDDDDDDDDAVRKRRESRTGGNWKLLLASAPPMCARESHHTNTHARAQPHRRAFAIIKNQPLFYVLCCTAISGNTATL
jgi:hypothetical protein